MCASGVASGRLCGLALGDCLLPSAGGTSKDTRKQRESAPLLRFSNHRGSAGQSRSNNRRVGPRGIHGFDDRARRCCNRARVGWIHRGQNWNERRYQCIRPRRWCRWTRRHSDARPECWEKHRCRAWRRSESASRVDPRDRAVGVQHDASRRGIRSTRRGRSARAHLSRGVTTARRACHPTTALAGGPGRCSLAPGDHARDQRGKNDCRVRPPENSGHSQPPAFDRQPSTLHPAAMRPIPCDATSISVRQRP